MGDYTKGNSNPTNSDINAVDSTKGENIHQRALAPDLSWQDRQSDRENGMTHNVPYRPKPVYGGTGYEQMLFNAEYNNEHGYNNAIQQKGIVGLNDSYHDKDIRWESELEDLNEFRANHQRWWEQLGGGLGRYATITAAGTVQNTLGTVAGVIGGLTQGFEGNQEQIVDDNGKVWDVDADGHKVIKDENGRMFLCDDNGNLLQDENGNPIESKATFDGFWGRFWNGFINNEVNTFMNDVIEGANEAMPVYRTKDEQEAGLLESIITSGFWADQVANLGWTSAAILSTVATGGMGAASAAGGIAKALSSSPRAAQFMYRLVGGITGSMAEASTEAIGAYNKAKGQYNKMSIDNYKESMKSIDDTINQETIDELRRLGINPATADRAIIDTVRDKIAQSHSNEVNDNINKYKFNADGFEKSAQDAALNTFGANVLVLSLTNTIGTFSNISTPFSNANRIAKGSIVNPFLERGQKIAATKGELYARKALEVLSQGNEEMLQAIATDAAVNYSGQRFDPNNANELKSYFDVAGEAFVGNLSSIESWKEYAAGLITGVVGAPGAGHKHTHKENKAGEMGSRTGLRPNWNGGIWGMKSEVEEEHKTSSDIFNEYNSEYNNLAQSPNLKAKTAMLIGVIGDNNAMGEAARDNDKKAYIDKEGEKLMRTTEAFANVGRLGELTSLVGEDTNMTDEQLKEFAAMNSEEIKDENGNGTGKFKSSLPIVDSNGELITNTKEGCEKLRERLKKDQNKAKKFIKEYAKTLEEVDSTTGYQLNREQLAMLTWMRMKSVLGEERQDDMTKDKMSLMKKIYEAYKRNKTYTDKNDDDYDKNLEKESEYLRQLLEKYKDVKDEDLTNEEKESRNIFTSELRRINRAKEVLREEKGKLQREKKNRENKERDTSEENKDISRINGTNRVELSDKEEETPKTMTELLFETLIDTMSSDPERSGSIMGAVLGHKIGTRRKGDNNNETPESVYFADILKDIVEKDNTLNQKEYEDFVDYLNDMVRLEQDKFAFDSMFRKLIGAPEHVRDYMDKVLNKIEDRRQKAINKNALEEYIKANGNIDFEYVTPDDILKNKNLTDDEKQKARDHIIQNNEKARTAENTRQFNKILNDVIEKAKEDSTTPEDIVILNQLALFLNSKQYKNVYEFIYQTPLDFERELKKAFDNGTISSVDNIADMLNALSQMQDALRKDLLQQIEMNNLMEQAQKKGVPQESDNIVEIQSIENVDIRDKAKQIIKGILGSRESNKEAKKLYDDAIKTLVDYAKDKNISIPNDIKTEDDIEKLIISINSNVKGLFETGCDAWYEPRVQIEKGGKEGQSVSHELASDEDKENFVKNNTTKAIELFNIANAISLLTNGEAFNFGKNEEYSKDGEYASNLDYTIKQASETALIQSGSKFGDVQFLDCISLPEGEDSNEFFKKVSNSGVNVITVEYEPTDDVNVPFVLMQLSGKPSVNKNKKSGNIAVLDNQTMFVAVPRKSSSTEGKIDDKKENPIEQKPLPKEDNKESKGKDDSKEQKPVVESKDLSKQKATLDFIDNLKEQLDKYVFFNRDNHTYFLYTGNNLEEATSKFNNGEITRENAAENGFKVHDISVSSLRYGREESGSNSPEAAESREYGNDIDLIVREYHKGTSIDEIKQKLIENGRISRMYGEDRDNPDDKALNFDYVDDFIKEVKTAEDEIKKMYPDCKIITDEISLAAWIKQINGTDLKEEQLLLAGQPDMLVVDKDGIVHIFDMKAKKISGDKKEDILISETNKNEYNGKNDYERYTTQLLGYARMLEAYGINVDTKNVNLIQFSTVKKEQNDHPTFVGISKIDASKCKPAIIHTNDISSISFGNTDAQTASQAESNPIIATAAAATTVDNDNNNKTLNAIKDDISTEIKAVSTELDGKDNANEQPDSSLISINGNDSTFPQMPTVEEFNSKQVGYVVSDVLEYRREEEAKGVYKRNDSSKLQQYLKKAGAYEYLNSGKLRAGTKVFMRTLEDEVNGPENSTRAMGVYVLDGKNADGSPKFQIVGVVFDDSTTRSGYSTDNQKCDTSHNIRCNIGNAVTGMGGAFTRRNTNTEGTELLSSIAYLTDTDGNKRQVNVGTKPIARKSNNYKKIVGKDQFGVERDFIPVENTDGKRLVVSSILLGRIQQNADIDNEKDHKPVREVTSLEESFDDAFNSGKVYVGIITQKRSALLIGHDGSVIQDIGVSIPKAFPTGASIVAFKDGRNQWRCSLVLGKEFSRNDLDGGNYICSKIKHLMLHTTSDNKKNGILYRIDLLKNYINNPLVSESTINNIINNLTEEFGNLFNYLNRKPVVTIDQKTLTAKFDFKLSNGEVYSYSISMSNTVDIEKAIYDMIENAGLRYSINQQVFISSDVSKEEKGKVINNITDLLKTNISDFSTRNTRFALSFEDNFIVGEKNWIDTPQKTVVGFGNDFIVKLNSYDGTEGKVTLRDERGNIISNEDVAKEFGYNYSTPEEANNLSNTMSALLNEIMKNIRNGNTEGLIKVESVNDRSSVVYFNMKTRRCITDAEFNSTKEKNDISKIVATAPEQVVEEKKEEVPQPQQQQQVAEAQTKISEKPPVQNTDTQPTNNKQKNNKSNNMGRKMRRELSVVGNRKKNNIFKRGVGEYDAKDVLNEIGNDISSFIESVIPDSMKIKVLSDDEFNSKYGERTDGLYSREDGIVVRESCNTSTVIHELCHAIVPNILQDTEASAQLRDVFTKFKKYLELHNELAQENYEGVSVSYSTRNLYEFLGELFSNERVADILKGIPEDYFVKGELNDYEVNMKYMDKITGNENRNLISSSSKSRNLINRIVDAIIQFFRNKLSSRVNNISNLYKVAEKAGKDLLMSFSESNESKTNKETFDYSETNRGISNIASDISSMFNGKTQISVSDISNSIQNQINANRLNISSDNKNSLSSTIVNMANTIKAIHDVAPEVGNSTVFERKPGNIYKSTNRNTIFNIDGNTDNKTEIKSILEQVLKKEIESMLYDNDFAKDIANIGFSIKSRLIELDVNSIDNLSISGINNIDTIMLAMTNPSFISVASQLKDNNGYSIIDSIKNSFARFATRNNKNSSSISKVLEKLNNIGNNNINNELKLKIDERDRVNRNKNIYSNKINRILDSTVYSKREGFVGAKSSIIKLNNAGLLSNVMDMVKDSSIMDGIDSQRRLFNIIIPTINGRNYTQQEIDDIIEDYNDYRYGYSTSYEQQKISCMLDIIKDLSLSSIISEGINVENNQSNFVVFDKNSIFADKIKELEEKCNI